MELTIIMVLFAVALIWAVFIYIMGIKKDPKILNDYLANKHKKNTRLKRSVSTRKEPVLSEQIIKH